MLHCCVEALRSAFRGGVALRRGVAVWRCGVALRHGVAMRRCDAALRCGVALRHGVALGEIVKSCSKAAKVWRGPIVGGVDGVKIV